jgi:hypothetical protein
MSAKAPIQPFWQRLPEIARYPLQGAALPTIAVLVLLIALFGWFPILGLLVTGVCWLAAYKYAFEILQDSAHGKPEPPESVLRIDGYVVIYYLILQVILFVVPLLLMLFSPPLGWVALVLSVLMQPVAIMCLAMSGSLGNALDPSRWFAVVSRIGWPYLAVVGLLFVIQASAANAGSLLSSLLPGLIAGPLVNVFAFWGIFATFHLMGYLIYQYHEALHFEPEAHQALPGRPRNRDQLLLDQAGERLQAGEPEAALVLLREEMRERAVTPEVHELYRRLLRQADDRTGLIEHGRIFLHLLLLEKQERRALGLARECLDLDPDFTTPEVEDGARLAQRAATLGQSALAIDLLRAAIGKDPRHPDMPALSRLQTNGSGLEVPPTAVTKLSGGIVGAV